jgi:hypothetical protein
MNRKTEIIYDAIGWALFAFFIFTIVAAIVSRA